MSLNGPCQRRGELLIPAAVFGIDSLGVVVGTEIERIQPVAMGRDDLALVPTPVQNRQSPRPVSLILQGSAQIVECRHIVRIQFKGLAIAGDCFVRHLLMLQYRSQVRICNGMAGIQSQGLAQRFGGGVTLALAIKSDAQVHAGLDRAGIQFENSAVASDGLVQVPLVLQNIAQVEQSVRPDLDSIAEPGVSNLRLRPFGCRSHSFAEPPHMLHTVQADTCQNQRE